jgi:hypothetical protein
MQALDMGYHYVGGIVLGVAEPRAALDAPRLTLEVKPNPFRDRVAFTLPSGTRSSTVTVANASGRIVYRSAGASPVWNAGGLPAGVYCYRLSIGSTTHTGRVAKLD